jgi:hypothetical protein
VLTTAGIHHCWFLTQVLLKTKPCTTPKSQWNSSLPIQCCLLDPYGRLKVVDSCLLCPCCCVGGQGNCADNSWDPSLLIFDPSFAI